MPRSARAPKLESRTNRLKLPIAKKPVFVRIAPGVSLGYRRNETAGTWVVRVADGRGGAWTKRVGTADDLDESDGQGILTFWEAQNHAKAAARGEQGSEMRGAPLTVEKAAQAYLTSLEARNRRTAYDARLRLTRLFLPRFGASRIEDLTRRQLEEWRDGLVETSDDLEQGRRSRDTANRVLTIVKAVLNHAVGDRANSLNDDSAWRLVRPFQRVARAREIHFTPAEVMLLLKAAEDACFRDLLTAGFLTGARYHFFRPTRTRGSACSYYVPGRGAMDHSAEPSDQEIDAAIAEFGGDLRATIRALLHDISVCLPTMPNGFAWLIRGKAASFRRHAGERSRCKRTTTWSSGDHQRPPSTKFLVWPGS